MTAFRTDLCQHGLLHCKSRRPVRKPTRLVATDQLFMEKLGLICDGSHVHDVLIGSVVCAAAGRYTELFAKRICEVINIIKSRTPSAPLAPPVPSGEMSAYALTRDDPDDVLGSRAITFPDGTPAPTQSYLRRLHQNLGHPSAADFVRNLKLNGANQKVPR